jgi:hypothetical protein
MCFIDRHRKHSVCVICHQTYVSYMKETYFSMCNVICMCATYRGLNQTYILSYVRDDFRVVWQILNLSLTIRSNRLPCAWQAVFSRCPFFEVRHGIFCSVAPDEESRG